MTFSKLVDPSASFLGNSLWPPVHDIQQQIQRWGKVGLWKFTEPIFWVASSSRKYPVCLTHLAPSAFLYYRLLLSTWGNHCVVFGSSSLCSGSESIFGQKTRVDHRGSPPFFPSLRDQSPTILIFQCLRKGSKMYFLVLLLFREGSSDLCQIPF